MVRKAFLVALGLATLSSATSAQIRDKGREDALRIGSQDPFAKQDPPVYLKTLTSREEDNPETRKEIEKDHLLDETINRLGRAFELRDPEALESCLVTGKRRIYLALDIDEQRRRHYGPGQVRHIFGRLFRDIETHSFVYDSSEVEHQSGGAVFRADWTYVVLDTDEVVTERLQFKLEQSADDWRVYDIRAASR